MEHNMNMRFKEYLLEAQKDPREVAQTIMGHCLPYVNAVGDIEPSTVLYRGTESAVKDFEARMRNQRGGLAGNYKTEVVNTINTFFNRKCTGLSLNNLIYTVNDPSVAANFGSPFVVFPIGDFSYAWSQTGKPMPDIIRKGNIEEVNRELMAANYICGHCNDNSEDGMEDNKFKQGIASGHEVLISAKGYFPISLQYWKQNGQRVMEEISMERM